MTISRAVFEQEKERIGLIAGKIRRDVFCDTGKLYSIDDIAGKPPRFSKIEIGKAIQLLKSQAGVLVCHYYGGMEYYGHRYI